MQERCQNPRGKPCTQELGRPAPGGGGHGAQYLLMPKSRTPWNWGSLGRRTLSREAVLITKCAGSYLV